MPAKTGWPKIKSEYLQLHNDTANNTDQWHDELAHQFNAIDRFETERRILALIPVLIAAIWLPLWLCAALMAANFLTELLGYTTLRRVVALRDRSQYRIVLISYVTAQLLYLIAPALVWQAEDPYAKAIALGIYLVSLTHIATIRSVHLPLAAAHLVPATLIGLLANTLYWWGTGKWSFLALSTFCILTLTYFVAVTVRTVHELYRDLARDRRAAQVANEAKSRFLAQISHELRTPLNAVMGLGVVELAQAQSAESRARLATLVQSARGLAVLLDDILDLSAVEAGALPIRPQRLELEPEIEATLALFRNQIADAGQVLEVSFEDLPRAVKLDGQRMRQCLSNVLSNAIKYGGPGELSIRVRLSGPDRLMIDLSDNGPGVPPALHDRIFEPFWRGTVTAPGAGLGLAISRRLAQRMGGDLVLLPSARGAHFQLTLAVEPAADETAPDAATPALADLAGRRVLVVDDIATNRMVAVAYLQLMGASALECGSGQAALSVLARETVDLILLDLVMPDMDGVEALRLLRALGPDRAAIPIIAMTADVSEERRAACLAAGMDGFVGKPVSPEVLSAAIIAAMSARRTSAQGALAAQPA